jgi:hypothetical protein
MPPRPSPGRTRECHGGGRIGGVIVRCGPVLHSALAQPDYMIGLKATFLGDGQQRLAETFVDQQPFHGRR